MVDWIFKSHPRSRPFPGIPASHSRSQKSGRQFSFPFPFPKVGKAIFIPVPIPKCRECNFYSRSHSQKLGMQFVIPIPVPKLWEWVELFPIPFPKSQK